MKKNHGHHGVEDDARDGLQRDGAGTSSATVTAEAGGAVYEITIGPGDVELTESDDWDEEADTTLPATSHFASLEEAVMSLGESVEFVTRDGEDPFDVAESLHEAGLWEAVIDGERWFECEGEPTLIPEDIEGRHDFDKEVEADWDGDWPGGSRHEILGHVGERWFFVETDAPEFVYLGRHPTTAHAFDNAAPYSALLVRDQDGVVRPRPGAEDPDSQE